VGVEDVTRMSFWYPLLKEFSIESRSFRCSEDLVNELAEAFFKALEGDAFMIFRNLLRKHPDLRGFLAEAIGEWGGVFIRGDKASPKDSCLEFSYLLSNPFKFGLVPLPKTQCNACIALKPEAALALIISSERVMNIGDPGVLWVRKPTRLRGEVRVFVKDLKPRLISWYYPEEPLSKIRGGPSIMSRMDDLEDLTGKVHDRTGLKDFTLDVGFRGGDLVVVELTPFPVRDKPFLVDPIMFRSDFWKKLKEAVENNTVIARYPVEEVTVKEVIE